MKIRRTHSGGFTLMELMVVIMIIGLLAAVIMTALQQSRTKGRDTQRVQAVKELQKAVELYYSEYGYYPPLALPANDARSSSAGTPCSDNTEGNANWCKLIADIAPYYRGGLDDPSPSGIRSYYYDADGAQPQYYGIMVMFESSANDDLAQSDGGFYCTSGTCADNTRAFEVGNEPRYCMQQGWGDWRSGGLQLCGSGGPTP